MRTGSRHINLDALSTSIARPPAIRPVRDPSARVGAAGLELANDLLSRSVGSPKLAEQLIERLRRDARAIEVAFWMVTGADTATCIVRVGDLAVGQPLPTITIATRSMAQRLRHPGVILCNQGSVTGAEELVTASASSYAILACTNDADITGVLVMAWNAPHPPVDDTTVSHLRIATGALLRSLFGERLAGSRVAAAREEERTRIARELHDDIGQQAAMLSAKIEMLLLRTKASAATLRDGIVDARQNVQDLAVSIHKLSHELHPPKLKLLGLVRTLDSLCKSVSKGGRINVTFASVPVPDGIPEHLSLCLCRVAQEALQNAMKHSGARDVAVALDATASQLMLRVSDSGHGFDPASLSSEGIGLTTMRDRVESNGGRLQIHPSPSGGVTIEAVVPILQSR